LTELAGGSAYVPTGVKGVDELLDGKGVPEGHSVLVLGAPGSGKTTFGLQFLVKGAELGEKGVYVTLDEPPSRLVKNAANVGIKLEPHLESKMLTLLDASPIAILPPKLKLGKAEIARSDAALATLINSVSDALKAAKIKRVVIDPVTALIVHFDQPYEQRIALLELMSTATKAGSTTLLIGDLDEATLARKHRFEEFVTDGVVVLTEVLNGSTFTRVFSVEKMRGVQNDNQPHPYRIGRGGIEVYPNEQIF